MDDAELGESANMIDDRIKYQKALDTLEIWANSNMVHLYFATIIYEVLLSRIEKSIAYINRLGKPW